MTSDATTPIDIQALHEALPVDVWITEAEAVDLLIPVVDHPEPFRETDAKAALDSLDVFGLILRYKGRVYRASPIEAPRRLSIIHGRGDRRKKT
jgi:hypothetical protein